MAAITDLATASSAGDSDYLVLNQGGTDRKMTRTMLGLTGTGRVATGGYVLTVGGTSAITGSCVGSITGGGTIATGGYTLTVPATGSAALLAVQNIFSAGAAFGAAGKAKMGVYQATTVTTSPLTILSPTDRMSLMMVWGTNGGSTYFCDLLLGGTFLGVSVVKAHEVSAPAARTYALSGADLVLTMASATYTVQAVTVMTIAD